MALRVDRFRLRAIFVFSAAAMLALGYGAVRFGNHSLENVIVACKRMLFLFGDRLSLGTMLSILMASLLIVGIFRAVLGSLADLFAVKALERAASGNAVALDGDSRVLLTEGVPYRAWTSGLLNPRIFIDKETFDGLAEGERAALIAHERSHIANGDLLKRAAADALRRLFWFIPTIAEVSDIMRFGQEVRADKAAMAKAGKRALCGLYLTASCGKVPSYVSGFAFATPRLSEVLDGKTAKAELSLARLIVSVAMAGLLCFAGWQGLAKEAYAATPATCDVIETMASQSFTPLVGPFELYTPRPENACSGGLSC